MLSFLDYDDHVALRSCRIMATLCRPPNSRGSPIHGISKSGLPGRPTATASLHAASGRQDPSRAAQAGARGAGHHARRAAAVRRLLVARRKRIVAFTYVKQSGTQGDVDVYTAALEMTELKPLAVNQGKLSHEEWAAWSPDGKRIAFTSTSDGNQEIYAVNFEGGDRQRLTNDPALDAHPPGPPNGSKTGLRHKPLGRSGTGDHGRRRLQHRPPDRKPRSGRLPGLVARRQPHCLREPSATATSRSTRSDPTAASPRTSPITPRWTIFPPDPRRPPHLRLQPRRRIRNLRSARRRISGKIGRPDPYPDS